LRIALGQFEATRDKASNAARIADLTVRAAAAGARLVVFPEAAMVAVGESEPLWDAAEPLDGHFVSGLRDLAARQRIGIVCGVFEPADGERVFNTAVAVTPDGGLAAAYRKIHLYDAFAERESDRVAPGAGELGVWEQDGTRLGLMTCYDLRFPELARQLIDAGTEALVLPAAWVRGLLKETHWEVLVRARAIENTVWVAACGAVGPRYCGGSMVVDPMGVTVARAGEVEQLVVADLCRERLEQVRHLNPSLRNRRIPIGTLKRPAHAA
jgi:predicted amidohydrolase